MGKKKNLEEIFKNDGEFTSEFFKVKAKQIGKPRIIVLRGEIDDGPYSNYCANTNTVHNAIKNSLGYGDEEINGFLRGDPLRIETSQNKADLKTYYPIQLYKIKKLRNFYQLMKYLKFRYLKKNHP